MKPRLLAASVLGCWLAMPGASQQPAAPSTQVASGRHVIVVSLDGFPAYMLQDAKLPLPVLRRLIKEGGVADGMKPVNPTVTWPNHTAMVTGVNSARHGVIYNGLPVRPGDGKPIRIEPWIDQNVLVQARTVYEAAHDAGLTTAEVDWVAIYRSAAVNWSFGEQPHADGTVEREMVQQGLIGEDDILSFAKSSIAWRDDLWTRAAAYIIERHKPNLLLMHLLTTDSVQHQYGARSLAAQTALILADRQLQRILDAIERAGIRRQTTLLVVSDHGFKTYRHAIRANALLREKGLLRGEGGQIDCDAWVVAEGGTAMVYVTRETRREATLTVLNEAFPSVPGITKVILPGEYEQYGYPKVVPQGRMADMVLVAAPGYAFTGDTTGEVVSDVPAGATLGNHGYLNSDPDMNEILVAWGAGIRPGSHTGLVPNIDVAPTIADLLHVDLPASQGRPLQDLLEK
ncbi:MAG: alkaline phosphatase family protein [Bryobacteraceae bacterium]